MKLDRILKKVKHPTRYIGMEMNSVNKNLDEVNVRFAFAFPDLYEVGMSHLGLHILYYLLNNEQDVFCERVFMVETDLEEQLIKNNLDLFTLETKTELKKMDFIGFTLQYELSYTNILKMMELSHIPFYKKDRDKSHPIIIGGGPTGFNPEPIADFFDLFLIGEAEELLPKLMELYKRVDKDKAKFLESCANWEGVYVPSFFDIVYKQDGTINSVNTKYDINPRKVISFNMDENFYPDRMIVPYMDIVHDRAMVEIFRGCTRGCRFCQAGMIYRPIRERSETRIVELAMKILENTGYEEMSLTSLSTMDHTRILNIVDELEKKLEEKMIGLSLPSLRLDSFSIDVVKKLQKVRKSSLTFAPEAGTQRMRDIINKGVTEEDLMNTLGPLFKEGWDKIKLYFMVGLPYETMEDVEGIYDVAMRVKNLYKESTTKKRLSLTISSSNFVPKPFTPFQWERQDSKDEMFEKAYMLKDKFRKDIISFNYHDPRTSFMEGVFSRGDRKLSKVLIEANKLGIKMDGWQEYFDFKLWMEAFENSGIDPNFYTRKREYDEILPWDHLSCGVDKEFLIKENELAKNGIKSIDCRNGCIGCGVNVSHLGGVC
jgi:radical SAM family uncharacterized protein